MPVPQNLLHNGCKTGMVFKGMVAAAHVSDVLRHRASLGFGLSGQTTCIHSHTVSEFFAFSNRAAKIFSFVNRLLRLFLQRKEYPHKFYS
jgi:hypothetical protein